MQNPRALVVRVADNGADKASTSWKPIVAPGVSGDGGEAEAIVRALGGRWSGRGGICRCLAHEDADPSLSVAQGLGGRLLLHCFAGCGFEDVLAALGDLGLVDRDRPCKPIPSRRVDELEKDARDRAKRMRTARAILTRGLPIDGTLAETYLRNRAIRTTLPVSLCFIPEARHAESARSFPAMAAAVIREGDVLPCAVHLTYLVPPGAKAPVSPVKRMIGPVKGAAVRLATGPGPLVV